MNMLRKLQAASLLSLLGFVALQAPAHAYGYGSCLFGTYKWSGSTITVGASTVSFPVGSYVRSNLDEAINAWNAQAPGGNFRFSTVADASTSFSSGDGKNSIYFNSTYGFNGALAVTLTRLNCVFTSKITEADILFNNAYSWAFDPAPGSPPNQFSPYNFNLVAVHELGHAFGLKHENARLSTMNDCYPNGGPLGNFNQIHPHSDDVLGDRAGYGTSGSPQDLAVTTYRSFASGTCAATSDRIASPAIAYRGVPTNFLFTIENRGTSTQSPSVSFYLSNDRWIDASDLAVGSASFSMAPGFVGTYNAGVVLPMSVAPGSYYFGWNIDPGNSIGEVNESNNAVALLSPTTVPSYSPPTACLSASPDYGSAPLFLQADASCSFDPDGASLTYDWDFGDGSAYRGGAQESHVYFADGNYTVTVTVTDSQALTSSASRFVTVCTSGGAFCFLQ